MRLKFEAHFSLFLLHLKYKYLYFLVSKSTIAVFYQIKPHFYLHFIYPINCAAVRDD